MSMLPTADNPIVYAQFNLQGRWKRMLVVAGSYGVLIGITIWLTTMPRDTAGTRDLVGWLGGLTALQVLNLLVFGTFRVESAVRGDVTSRMIESHRMMPTAPLGSILGYIFGSPMQALLLCVVNYLLGMACCLDAGLHTYIWTLLNGTLLFFAIFIYAMITQFSFIARGGFMLFLIFGAISLVTAGNEGLHMLPSASVLFFPLLGRSSVFALQFNSGWAKISSDLNFAYASALMGQAAIIAIAIRIAMRRYLSSSAIGMSPALGLMLLLVWVALAAVQFGIPDFYASLRYQYNPGREDMLAETLSAVVTSSLLAMFPIASAARSAQVGYHITDPTAAKPNSRTSLLVIVIASGTIVCLLLADIPIRIPNAGPVSLTTVFILFNFLAGIACLFSWGYLRRRRAWIIAMVWVAFTWIGPIVANAVYLGMTDNTADATQLIALSPAGAIGLMWSRSSVQVLPGILGQVAISMVPVGLLLRAQTRHKNAMKKLEPRLD